VEPEPDIKDIPLQSHRALQALLQLLKDSTLVHLVATSDFASWRQLATATPSELHEHLGPWAARLRVPPTCPDPLRPKDSRLVSRYESRYPGRLLLTPTPPVLLEFRGPALSAQPRLLLAAGRYPSAAALRKARAAVDAASQHGLSVLGLLDGGASEAAILRALDKRLHVTVVTDQSPARLLENEPLARRILNAGGTLVADALTTATYAPSPLARHIDPARERAWQLATALSDAMVLCEAGLHASGGAEALRAALHAGRPIAISSNDPASVTRPEHLAEHVLVRPKGPFGPLPERSKLYTSDEELTHWMASLTSLTT